MLKYVDLAITFTEVPDEISLCIDFSGCPIQCPGCHSKYLWKDEGTILSLDALKEILKRHEGITCVCLMGGDQDPNYINLLAQYIKLHSPWLKVAWYSGNVKLSEKIDLEYFDYYKIGPYIESMGGLDNPETNQAMFEKTEDGHWNMINYKFYKSYGK